VGDEDTKGQSEYESNLQATRRASEPRSPSETANPARSRGRCPSADRRAAFRRRNDRPQPWPPTL